MKQILTTIAILLVCTEAIAQTDYGQFTVDGQIRTRGEYNNGAGTLRKKGQGPATFINDRVRLGIGWERENLSLKFSAQHTGVWGDDALKNGTAGKNGEIGINEAWAKLKFADQKGYVQLGRQVLAYDDERLLGGLDWATSGQSHDALRLGYQEGKSIVNVVLAYNQPSESKSVKEYNNIYQGIAPYQHMEVLWYHLNVFENFGGSFLFMNTGVQTQATDAPRYTSNMQTTGVYLNGRTGNLSLDGAFYYQFGKQSESTDISAFMASLNAKYKFNDRWSVDVGDDYLSGNSYDDASGKCKKFNTLYGTHHKFYGTMDIMNGGFKNGMNDLNANIAYKASQKIDASAAFHYFASPGLKTDKTLGSELDLQVNWKVMKNVTFQCGYSMFFATKNLTTDPGCWNDWGWISLNINPRLFASKKQE